MDDFFYLAGSPQTPSLEALVQSISELVKYIVPRFIIHLTLSELSRYGTLLMETCIEIHLVGKVNLNKY